MPAFGLRTDFEGEAEPEASEPRPAISLSTNFPEEIQTTVGLARGYTIVLSLDDVLKRTVPAIPLRLARFRSKRSLLIYMS